MEELRDLTAYVPQDAYLFDGTILENIGYGNPEASEDEILAAAKRANAHGFILEQADGYNTLVGEEAPGFQEASASVSPLPGPS